MAGYSLEFEKQLLELEKHLDELKALARGQQGAFDVEIDQLEQKIEEVKKRTYDHLSAWQRVQISRHPERPVTRDYIEILFTDWMELKGDRLFSEDPAVIGGPAFFQGEAVMVIGEQRGKGTKEKMACNFGMPHPEGYRKALRLMKMAEKFSMPVITFIDSQGAYPGVGAEERGQAWAIANNLMAMSALRVPIVAINIGEGGSGGALALGVGDRVLMLENAYYSVITPEGCASILYKDSARAEDAAESLKLTADCLMEFGIIDEIIEEPVGGAHRGAEETAENVKKAIAKHLKDIKDVPTPTLLDERYARLRKIGVYEEGQKT